MKNNVQKVEFKTIQEKFFIPEHVKNILDNKKIPEEKKWCALVNENFKRGSYKKPELPCYVLPVLKNDDKISIMKEISKVHKNWFYLERLASDYEIILEFYIQYPNLICAGEKIREYAEFLCFNILPKNSELKIFDTNGKIRFGVAKQIYYSQYEKLLAKLNKKGKNKKNLEG